MALIVVQEIQMAKFSRTVGPDKNYDIPGRTKQYHGMYIGYVKSNTDVQKMGRLQVWIPEFGSQEKDASGWFTISYSSPFAGATFDDDSRSTN